MKHATDIQAAEHAEHAEETYWSVDSAPQRFAEKVPVLRGPVLLALFSLFAYGQLWLINTVPELNSVFVYNDWVLAPASGQHAIPLRIFIISFFAAFALCCDPRIIRKVRVLLHMLGAYVLFFVFMDVMLHAIFLSTGVVHTLHLIEILSGLGGFVIFSFKLLENGKMPTRIPLQIDNSQTRTIGLRLVLVTVIAAGVAWVISGLDLPFISALRSFSALGGIGPGVFLFLPVFFMLLYLGAVIEDRMSRKGDFSPDLTVFMPAHNEEHIITDTIRAMDAAAEKYDGTVKLLVMNNASEDETVPKAQTALAACKSLQGEVIEVPLPGKANALNAGLDRVDTEFCVRVDADTQLLPDAFSRAMRHFVEPSVGVVGGLPLPPGGGLFDRARYLEVAVKHGFYSVALSTINSVVGIPGMFSVYRTKLPRSLGGFVEGMNGEDTDISLRAGESGYKLIVDPTVRYISEVPKSYTHMREQRTRWFRSTFHISARCRDLIFARKLTMRGKLVLPYMLVNSARRTMMVPLFLFGVIEYLTAFDSFNILTWQAVLAVFIGAPSLMAVISALLLRRPRAILYIPQYLIFRVLRAYFTMESMLSISINNRSMAIDAKAPKHLQQPRDLRVA